MQFRKKPQTVEAWEITPQLFDDAFTQQLPQLQGVTFHMDQSGQYVTTHSEITNVARGDLGDWIVRSAAGKIGIYPRARFAESYDAIPPTLTIEQEAKPVNAPRLTPAMIQAVIKSEHYFTALQGARLAALDAVQDAGGCIPSGIAPLDPELGLLSFCVLVLRNGYKAVGMSACAAPENFDQQKGRELARVHAVNEIWQLEGYVLKQQLYLDRNLTP